MSQPKGDNSPNINIKLTFLALLPITIALGFYNLFSHNNMWIWAGLMLVVVTTGYGFIWKNKAPVAKGRRVIEFVARTLILLCAAITIFVTAAIAFALVAESVNFFKFVSPADFFFGLKWQPGVAHGQTGSFGIIPLLTGTLLITAIAMLVAVPLGLLSAIYLSSYARPVARDIIKPLLEILAGVPTVVYGFFAIIAIAPLIQAIGELFGVSIVAESALGVGIVMGIMIIPYISSLSDDILRSVPQHMQEGSLAIGATYSEGIKRVIVPAAMPGILAAILLAFSRAIGETMIVVMAAGYSANLTANPLDAVTTITVQIVSLLTGDQEFSSPKTFAAYALGLSLFVMTLILNVIAMRIVKHYRKKYA